MKAKVRDKKDMVNEREQKINKADTEVKQSEQGIENKDGIKHDNNKDEKDRLKQVLDELDEYKDKYIRLCAEFDNARKRMEREKQEFVKYANEGILLDLLAIIDNLERSLDSVNKDSPDIKGLLKGINMVLSQAREVLLKHGVKPIEAKGKVFDPHCHEILMQEETDEFDEGIVIDEFQKGYYFNDRVLRTAKVKIARKKQEDEPSKDVKDGQSHPKEENNEDAEKAV